METLESLAQALKTTGEIQSIVRTMKTLSSVSIRQYERAEAAMAEYESTIELGLVATLHERRSRGLSLLNTKDASATHSAFIIVGSDRGLCGRYNESIANFAIRQLNGSNDVVGVMGARVAARLEAAGYHSDTVFSLPASVIGLTDLVQSVIIEIDRWMQMRHVDFVWLLHNHRAGRSTSVPIARQLLPLPDEYLLRLSESKWPGRSIPYSRMSPDEVLSWLVQQRLFVVLYRSLAEALASEHATRLAAMQSAERNIGERQESLSSSFRRERQESITRELLDVVAGFEANRAIDIGSEE